MPDKRCQLNDIVRTTCRSDKKRSAHDVMGTFIHDKT